LELADGIIKDAKGPVMKVSRRQFVLIPFNAHFTDVAREAGLTTPVIYGNPDSKPPEGVSSD
jgi:hypothetical protein